ncbi:TetR/AcrR family transcriptional regulator [Kribbella sp. VKM Ac-2568]|uniref:TetR/AcrR family transcriptional regulator n=1 Tax=Kribbella sp. VKM Ac-2568 TaxID=2512219 RepID=UPI00104ECA20|nr:TetR/AcrR family transcriptional regulator [Kribbella sp. VKM Ac-2568]TCM38144.1 TetR family transcriptional regulator [Kribbella sp. VKM Ac-2568]
MAAEEYASVWTRPKRKRREQPALSQKQIVAEAIKLLDAEGLEALSMRKLGAALGAVATAVYWHVANKEELIELVVDQIYGEIEVPEVTSPDEWRAAAEACAESFRGVILQHPWMGSTLAEVGLTYLGPNMMRVSDRMLALYEGGGFSLLEANQAATTVAAYVLGVASTEAATLTKLARSGLTADDWMTKVWPAAEQAAQDYPRMKELYAAHRGHDIVGGSEDDFKYGLARILDGLEPRRER